MFEITITEWLQWLWLLWLYNHNLTIIKLPLPGEPSRDLEVLKRFQEYILITCNIASNILVP